MADIYEARSLEEESLNDTEFYNSEFGDVCTCYRNVYIVNGEYLEIQMDYDPLCPNHGSPIE